MESKEENKRPPYRRGTGLRVTICHESGEQARYLISQNKSAGNELFRDEKGFIFTLVCKYDTCYRSK